MMPSLIARYSGVLLITSVTALPAAADEGYLPDDPPPAEPTPGDEPPAPRTLFDGPTEVGGWGALITSATAFNGTVANATGVRGGVMFGRTVTLGITGWGITTVVPADDGITIEYESGRIEEDVSLEGGAGGFFIQADVVPYQLVHPHVFGAIGAGGFSYSTRTADESGWGTYDARTTNDGGDSVVYGELGAGVTVNLVKWMRLDVSGSWRFMADVDLPGVTATELGGPSGWLAFRFGRF